MSTPAHHLHPVSVVEDNAEYETSRRRALDLLRSGIRSGAVHDQLVEGPLTKSLGVSRNAIREALQILAREGVVLRRPRLGTAVARTDVSIPLNDLMPDLDEREHRRVRLVQREVKRVPTNEILRVRLGTFTDSVVLAEQVVHLDDEPICVRTLYLATDQSASEVREQLRVIDARHHPTNEAFELFFGVRLGRIANYIKAMAGEEQACHLMGIGVGSPTLLRESVHVDVNGRARILVYAHYRGDSVSLFSDTWS